MIIPLLGYCVERNPERVRRKLAPVTCYNWCRRGVAMKDICIASNVLAAVAGLMIATASAAMAQTAVHHLAEVSVVKPETVGFSSERLERLHALIQQEVDQKQLAGAVTLLARHGKVVDYRTYGYRDIASGAPMTKDVIFRDYSMTKPVTGVAMMILYEN